MNSTALTTPVVFDGARITLVEHNGQRWIATRDLAAALEYEDTSTVTRIHARHSHEFTDEMTATVNMTVGVTPVPVRIFSPRGCHLIAMFARKPKAEAFRRWVLDVLETPAKPPEPPPAVIGTIPGGLIDRIDARAWKLAHAAFDDARRQMLVESRYPHFNPEQWSPVPRLQQALGDIEAAVGAMDAMGAQLRRHHAALSMVAPTK